MEILLFDEMQVDQVRLFRRIFQRQLEPGKKETNSFVLPEMGKLELSESAQKRWKFWREATMYPTLLTYSSKNVTPEQRAQTASQSDEQITAQLMRARFALGFFMLSPHASNKLLDEMRKGVTEYLVKNPKFVTLYHQLRLIAEPKLSLGDSLVFMAARPHSAELNKKLAPASLELTPTPDTVVVVPLTVWPFRNFGSWHLPSGAASHRAGSDCRFAVGLADVLRALA